MLNDIQYLRKILPLPPSGDTVVLTNWFYRILSLLLLILLSNKKMASTCSYLVFFIFFNFLFLFFNPRTFIHSSIYSSLHSSIYPTIHPFNQLSALSDGVISVLVVHRLSLINNWFFEVNQTFSCYWCCRFNTKKKFYEILI